MECSLSWNGMLQGLEPKLCDCRTQRTWCGCCVDYKVRSGDMRLRGEQEPACGEPRVSFLLGQQDIVKAVSIFTSCSRNEPESYFKVNTIFLSLQNQDFCERFLLKIFVLCFQIKV